MELAMSLDHAFDNSKSATLALAIAFARILADTEDVAKREEYIDEFVRAARDITPLVGAMLIRSRK